MTPRRAVAVPPGASPPEHRLPNHHMIVRFVTSRWILTICVAVLCSGMRTTCRKTQRAARAVTESNGFLRGGTHRVP
jgi:hypothetical protein